MSEDLVTAMARIEVLENLISGLRHDLRGAISSTSLVADALSANRDPVVCRAGQRIAATVERILTVINATVQVVPSRER